MSEQIIIEYIGKVDKLQADLKRVEVSQLGLANGARVAGSAITLESAKAAAAVQKVDKSTKGLKDSFDQLSNNLPFAGVIQQVTSLSGALTGAAGAAGKVSGAMNVLKVAIAGTGIGLLVLAFTSLVAFFKSTEAGGDKLAKIMRVVGAVFGEVVKVVADLGGFLVNIVESIFDYTSSSDRATKSTDDYKKSTMALAAEIADLEDEVSELNITVNINNSILQTGIEKNLRALRNRNIKLKDSLKLIEENGKAELEQLANTQSITDKGLEKERKIFIEKVAGSGILSDLALKRKKEILATSGLVSETERLRLQWQVENHEIAQKKIMGQLRLFDLFVSQQIDSQTKKKVDATILLASVSGTYTEEELKNVEALILENEAAIRNQSNASEKLQNFRDAAIDKDKAAKDQALAADRARNAKAVEESKKRLAEFQAAQIRSAPIELNIAKKLEEDKTVVAKREGGKRKKEKQASFENFKKMSAAEKDRNAKDQEAQTAKNLEQAAIRTANIKSGITVGADLAQQALQGINDLALAKVNSEIEIERAANQKITDDKLIQLQKRKDFGLITEEELSAQKARLLKKAAAQESVLKRKQFEANQKAAINRIAIDTAVATIKALAVYGPTPAAIIPIATLLASSAIQVALVKSQPVPKFKDGVIDYKGTGSETSDSNTVQISNRESIIRAKQSKKYKGALTAINNDTFEDFINRNHILPHAKRLEKENRESIDRKSNTAENILKALSLNGLDTSHLERLTKRNKSVKIDNMNELLSGMEKIMKPNTSKGL